MSWSISKTGTKTKVMDAVGKALDAAALPYAGTDEEKDILAVRERAMNALMNFDLQPDPVMMLAGSTYGVSVEAHGSRSSYGVTVALEIKRIVLTI